MDYHARFTERHWKITATDYFYSTFDMTTDLPDKVTTHRFPNSTGTCLSVCLGIPLCSVFPDTTRVNGFGTAVVLQRINIQ
jgi:hypothetical protein